MVQVRVQVSDPLRSVRGALGGDTTPQDESICATALAQPALRYVQDASAEPALAGLPWVDGRRAAVRLFAAAPLVLGTGQTVGTLCVYSPEAGSIDERSREALGDLAAQACQRFETPEDLVRHECTIEEREEYEPHIEAGVVVYAGVDYAQILVRAEAEADVVLWDGGNNDLPFYAPDLHLALADPLRPGDEAGYHPGEANVRLADLVIIAKCDSARPEDIERRLLI